jgi:hypothetical protein
MRAVRSFALTVAVLGLAHSQAVADPCTPARAMVVLDKSSSMITGDIAGTPKWNIAVDAISTVSAVYENSIELGLMMFPDPDQCSPGSVHVAPALGNHAAITAATADPPPSAGNWTPMSQTLDAAASVPTLLDSGRQRYLVLISDGWQWCSPYDPATRLDPVDSVANLKALGVAVYVVGFGDNVDAFALNQMAVEGGTALAGCDPTGDTPDAAAPCYYQADAAGDLLAALDAIALHIAAETCDGQDNDCDGNVDEELIRPCASACGAGNESCSAGAWIGCDAPPVAAEICDGIDNDCDGATDTGCACLAGDIRPCGDSDEGACATGTQTCDGSGIWGACDGAVNPEAETCDALDNDCDGRTDEIDDPAGGDLCPGSKVCRNGGCVDVDPGTPVEGEGDAPSCDCRAGARGDLPAGPAAAALILFAALMFVRRRR